MAEITNTDEFLAADDASTDVPSDNTSLVEVIAGYRSNGFGADFWAEEEGVRCGTCDVMLPASRFTMHSLRRLEGASDPADMVAVIATICPNCEAQGTLVVGFGPMASPADADVLLAIEDARNDDILPPSASPEELPDT